MNEVPEVFPAYRLVAEFADGQRLTFDGLTEQQAQDRMEAAHPVSPPDNMRRGPYYRLPPSFRKAWKLLSQTIRSVPIRAIPA